jgi:hypothetical protein
MTKKVDTRIPNDVGKGIFPEYPAIGTPWNKLISFHDAYWYGCRHNAVMAATFFEVVRILIPDYAERAGRMCRVNREVMENFFKTSYGKIHAANNFIHPFMCEQKFGTSAWADAGDERLMMIGRVNDFGTYRVEKELDTCPWDILGSEICRISPAITEGGGDVTFPGDKFEYIMPEARGCGDLHCRFMFENRVKYPLPPRKTDWAYFEDWVTKDQIKFTPEEEMLEEPQFFREECDFKYRSGVDKTFTAAEVYNGGANFPLGSTYCTETLKDMIAKGDVTEAQVNNIIECVFEGAGKMAYGEFYAKKGLCDWLGVPGDVKDGRILGGLIEVTLQVNLVPYKVLAFNKEESLYDINLAGLERRIPMLTPAYLAMWYGMSKTLVSPLWSCWRETEGVPQETLRLKIAKKIDKYAR